MTNINWESIIAAYRNGFTADVLIADYEREQGVIWTVAPCDPKALESAGRQFSRARATSIIHIRRAVLRLQGRDGQSVVMATELPSRRQEVRDLDTGGEVILRSLLFDGALTALQATFTSSATETV